MITVVPVVVPGLDDSAIFEISRRITEAQLRALLRAKAPNLSMFGRCSHFGVTDFAQPFAEREGERDHHDGVVPPPATQ